MADVYGYGKTPSSPTRDIWGDITGAANSLGSVVGFKPFKGGPYPDSGHLDDAQNAINNYTPVSDLGALSGLPQMYSQLAQQNGLPDPFSQMLKQQHMQPLNTTAGGAMGQPAGSQGISPQNQNEWWNQPYTPSSDPYALSQPTQRYLNQKQSDIGGAHQAAWQRISSNLSARGLGDSSTMAAAKAYLDQAYGNQGQEAETNVRGAEFDRKQQMSQYLANALTQMFNAQRQHSLDQAGIFTNQGQLSAAQNNNTMNFYRSLLAPFAAQGAGSLFGGGSGGGGGVSSADIFG